MEKTLHADDDEINTLAQTNSRVSLGRESSLDILQDDQRGSFNKVSLDEVPDSKEDPLVDETRKLSLEGDDARSDDPEVIDIKAVAKENEDIIPSARLNAPPTKKRKTAGGVKYHCDEYYSLPNRIECKGLPRLASSSSRWIPLASLIVQ